MLRSTDDDHSSDTEQDTSELDDEEKKSIENISTVVIASLNGHSPSDMTPSEQVMVI